MIFAIIITDMPHESLTPTSYANEVRRYLLGQGAEEVHAEFSVSREGQADLVFLGHRYLLVPNDKNLAEYRTVAKLSVQPSLQPSEHLSALSPHVVALEIPRDARTLEQVAVSTDGEATTNETVYGIFGRTVRNIIDGAHLVPKSGSFGLGNVLYSRVANEVILTPGTEFEASTSEAQYRADNAIRTQLMPRYKNFGGQAMYGAYLVGKGYDRNTK